jgi:pimeloyl-ACP methyl ester carboxylesterase
MRKHLASTPPEDSGHVNEHHVVLRGLRIHYLEWTNDRGAPVVLLHGGGLSAHTWDAVATALADRHHCYALDLRGHGDSEWSPTLEYSIAAHAEDLEAFVDNIGLDRFIVVGHSLGAFTALQYAAAHSDRLAGLVVVDATPFVKDGDEVDRLRTFMLEQTEFTSVDDAVEYTLRFQPQRDRTELHHSLRRSLRQHHDGHLVWKHDRRRVDARYFASVIEDARSLLDVVGQIRCPTLVIRGSDGCPAEDADRFAALLFDGQSVTVDGAGHKVHRDNYAGFMSALNPFLDEHQTLPVNPGEVTLGTPNRPSTTGPGY